MKKEKFLELASQLFDLNQPTNLEEDEKIPVQKDLMDEIVDQISSEIFDSGMGIVDDYDLGMCGREVELEGVTFNVRQMESLIKEVLERYFSTFEA
jgi:hypothetical protein